MAGTEQGIATRSRTAAVAALAFLLVDGACTSGIDLLGDDDHDIVPPADADGVVDLDEVVEADADADGDGEAEAAVPEPRECSSDRDCPEGWCRRVPDLPGGLWTCVYPAPAPATGPSSNPGWDLCSDSSDCETGCGCYLMSGVHHTWYISRNACYCTECETDADCPDPAHALCIAAGTWGALRNRCLYVVCRTNADCLFRPGGQCVAFRDHCTAGVPPQPSSKHCRYPDDPCATDRDCGSDWCVPGSPGFTCVTPWCWDF